MREREKGGREGVREGVREEGRKPLNCISIRAEISLKSNECVN